jgi:surfeit locus 1 family protein
MLLRMFSRKWILTTLLVVAAVAVMARLGIWQLDRLAQRRAFNSRVLAQVNRPVLNLDAKNIPADLGSMEYRKVVVTGVYDFSQQVSLRNQAHDNRWGVNLITPLHIQNSGQTILIDRGWVPSDDFTTGDFSKYDEPGTVMISGVIRASQSRPDFGWRSDQIPQPGEPRLEAWNFVNVGGISQQTPYPLLPVYIQQAPDAARTALPYRSQPTLDLTEGPHMGYALQWFLFASILGFGYPFFIRSTEQRKKLEQESTGVRASHISQ